MTVKVIASIKVNPEEPDALRTYLDVTMPLLDAAGGQIVQSFEKGESVVGELDFDRVMIVEYPDLAALDKVFKSEAYKAIIPIRDKAFTRYGISVISN